MKSYTDLEQSKKLAEILPLESADMFYNEEPEDETYPKDIVDTEYPMVLREGHIRFLEEYGIPCWSLAALLSVLNFPSLTQEKEDEWEVCIFDHDNDGYIEKTASNPVDVCVSMILDLHKKR
jgi:hypothetical protein